MFADKEIIDKCGVNEAVADTIGPGGVFYGARNVPVILDICRDMEELCPNAWLLNYSNPMAIITWAINDYTRVKTLACATAFLILLSNWLNIWKCRKKRFPIG